MPLGLLGDTAWDELRRVLQIRVRAGQMLYVTYSTANASPSYAVWGQIHVWQIHTAWGTKKQHPQ